MVYDRYAAISFSAYPNRGFCISGKPSALGCFLAAIYGHSDSIYIPTAEFFQAYLIVIYQQYINIFQNCQPKFRHINYGLQHIRKTNSLVFFFSSRTPARTNLCRTASLQARARHQTHGQGGLCTFCRRPLSLPCRGYSLS